MQHLSFYTAIIHTKTATIYRTYSNLEDVYTDLSTMSYLYCDIRCNGVLIHHKVGPCVPTSTPHAPLMRRHIFARALAWLRKKLLDGSEES